MVNLKKLLAVILSLSLVVVMLGACRPAPKPAEEEVIKVGFLGLLSGAGALYGRPILDGLALGLNEINDAGGVLGRKVVIISRDTGGRPEEAVRLARELILGERVQFVIGPLTDAENLSVSQVGKELETIIMPYIAKTNRLLAPENLHPYIFQMSTNCIYEMGVIARRIAEHQEWKSIYIIAPDYEYGHMQRLSFVNWMNELRPDMQIEEAWPALYETDYTAYITQIAESEPDVLLVVQWGGDFVAVMKQASAFGLFDKVKFIATPGENGSPEFAIALGEDYPEGVLANAMDVCYWPDTPEHNAYVKALADLSGEPYAHGNSIEGYIALKFLVAAIEKAGTTDSLAVSNALKGLTIDTPIGPLTVGEDHQLKRGMIWGYTKMTPDYPFVVLDQIEFIPWEDVVK